MKTRLKYEHINETIIQIYAPCIDTNSEEEKAEFFDKLSDTIDSVPDNDDLIVMGDFNGRVGPRRTPWETYLGPHSYVNTECNYNGEQLLALCAEHGLWITNTVHNHRQSQRQTWYKWNDLGVSSEIDFILTRAKDRRNTTDAQAVPNISLNTDHRPVIMTLKQKMWRNKRAKHRPDERINLRVLNEEETKQKFKEELGKTLAGIDLDALSMDEAWSILKASLIETLSKACGVKKAGKGPVKKTPWWNDNVKEAIKDKKKLYKGWVRSKLEEDYIKYRLASRHCKRVVKEAKEESWKKVWRATLSELCRHSPRNFYKGVKAMRIRDEIYDPATIINDQNGNPINDKNDIKTRWKEYFSKLLNNTQRSRTSPSMCVCVCVCVCVSLSLSLSQNPSDRWRCDSHLGPCYLLPQPWLPVARSLVAVVSLHALFFHLLRDWPGAETT